MDSEGQGNYASSDFDNSEEFEDDEEVDDIEEIEDQSPSLGAETFVQSEGLDSATYNDSNVNATADFDIAESISYADPEIMLSKLLRVNIDSDFNMARIIKIKCLALSKIIYGERHWKVADAHVQLANVYLKGKHYPQQIIKHTNIARDILLSGYTGEQSDESRREYLLQNLYYLMGRVNCQLSKYKVSENHLMKAKLVSDHSGNATTKFLTMKINIISALATTLSKLNQLGQAIEYLEEAIEIASKLSGSDKYLAINLHKQIVTIELSNGKNANISFAMESALKALELSKSFNGKDSSATAEIFVMLSRVEILKDLPDYDNIEKHLRNALEIYTTLEINSKVIHVQQMICKLFMKQEKFSLAKGVLKEAIVTCTNAYEDTSLQCAELNELMGNILFAENKMKNALAYLSKAEETLKGRKRYQERQTKITKLIAIIKKSQLRSNEMKKKGK